MFLCLFECLCGCHYVCLCWLSDPHERLCLCVCTCPCVWVCGFVCVSVCLWSCLSLCGCECVAWSMILQYILTFALRCVLRHLFSRVSALQQHASAPIFQESVINILLHREIIDKQGKIFTPIYCPAQSVSGRFTLFILEKGWFNPLGFKFARKWWRYFSPKLQEFLGYGRHF